MTKCSHTRLLFCYEYDIDLFSYVRSQLGTLSMEDESVERYVLIEYCSYSSHNVDFSVCEENLMLIITSPLISQHWEKGKRDRETKVFCSVATALVKKVWFLILSLVPLVSIVILLSFTLYSGFVWVQSFLLLGSIINIFLLSFVFALLCVCVCESEKRKRKKDLNTRLTDRYFGDWNS